MQSTNSQRKVDWIALTVVIIFVAVSGSVAVGLYASRFPSNSGNSNGTSIVTQQITIDQAVQKFKNYLGSLQDSNIALHEVEEYQYNFYASYYEKDTGTFAFQMFIWKQGAGYMMGMMGYSGATGVVVPEMGPNMMWNTKYHVAGGMMSSGMTSGGTTGYGMMGGGMMGNNSGQTASTPMTVTAAQAKTLAQQYLNNTVPGKMAGDGDAYYGYYNVDVLLNGSTFGMLSVNGYTGQVWYHSWHGVFIQTVTVS